MATTWTVGLGGDYTTFVSAIADSGVVLDGDSLLPIPSNANGLCYFHELVTLSRPLNILASLTCDYTFLRRLIITAVIDQDIVIENIHTDVQIAAALGVGSTNTVTIRNCEAEYFVHTSANGGSIVQECCFVDGYNSYGFSASGDALTATTWQNCTAYNCDRGFNGGVSKNCLSFCNTIDFLNAQVGSDYNISGDATASGANSLISQTATNLDILSSQLGGIFRIGLSSSAVGAGDLTGQPATDFYGVAFDSGTIGCMAGRLIVTDPAVILVSAGGDFDEAARNTDPGSSNVLKGTLYKIQDVQRIGTLESSAPVVSDNVMEAGAAFLRQKLLAHASLTATYTRDGDSITDLKVIRAETSASLMTDFGLNVDVRIADFLVREADLIIPPAVITTRPTRGDTIAITVADELVTYEVLADGTEDVSRESDRFGNMIRVHTKEIARSFA